MEISTYMNLPTQTNERSVIGKQKIRKVLVDDFLQIYPMIKVKNLVKMDKDLIIHIAIPSEVFLSELFYDVVIRFMNVSDTGITDKTHVQFYSNSPAFLFTFAYTYNTNGLLYDRMINKVGKFALTTPPMKTNPKRILGLEKSLYFAVEYIKKSGIHTRISSFNSGLSKLLKEVKSSEDKLEEYKLVKSRNLSRYNAYKAETPKFSFN